MSKEETSESKKKRLLKIDPSTTGLTEAKKIRTENGAAATTQPRGDFASEETEAMQRHPSADLASFRESCDFLKTSMKKIKELKGSGENTSLVNACRTDATVQFIHLKKLNRLSHLRCRKAREGTAEAKHRIDQCHLQLQNLLYEALHLQKEIVKCLEFKSKDEDIKLVSVEEFYQKAPETISKAETTKTDSHQQMLARLQWELEERKQLSSKLSDMQSEKESVSQEIRSKQDYLETLQPKLTSILQATRPVQEYLNVPFDQNKESHQMAQHLSSPLYVLYMQLSAYKDACDKSLKVHILGDTEAAKSFKNFVEEPEEDSDNSDQEESEKQERKRRRKTKELRRTERQSKILRKHPLSILLEISSYESTMLQLMFWYIPGLHIVTVTVTVETGASVNSISGGDLLSSESILDELYPGDRGAESPNIANQFELEKLGLQDLNSHLSSLGRPYLWCQLMAGLQFLPKNRPNPETQEEGAHDAPQHSVSRCNMEETIKRLKRRVRARILLQQQLASLEKGIVPVLAETSRLFPAKINSQLTSWTQSTIEDFKSVGDGGRAVKSGLVSDGSLFFNAVMERGSARLTCGIAVSANYPAVPPLFVVDILWQSHRTAATDLHVMEMEEEVNLHCSELQVENNLEHLLSSQVQRLLMCLDVYLETDTPASATVPIEIPKEKMVPRSTRGTARSKPYKFVPELGIFTHRC